MKRIITILVLSCVLMSGCHLFPNFRGGEEVVDEETPKSNSGDPLRYSRQRRIGTGVDAQARDIERRLGYGG